MTHCLNHAAIDGLCKLYVAYTDELTHRLKQLSGYGCVRHAAYARRRVLETLAHELGFLQKDEPLSKFARAMTIETLTKWGYQL